MRTIKMWDKVFLNCSPQYGGAPRFLRKGDKGVVELERDALVLVRFENCLMWVCSCDLTLERNDEAH